MFIIWGHSPVSFNVCCKIYSCNAEREPISLFEVNESEKDNTAFDEIFAWDRTASRLTEMQSAEYLTEWSRSMEGTLPIHPSRSVNGVPRH